MIQWLIPLAAVALSISLWLVIRRRASVAQRIGAALTQVLIWAAAWTLLQPPALLPAPQTATLQSSEPMALTAELAPAEIAALQTLHVNGDGLRRDALCDLPPVRLASAANTVAPTWRVDWPRELLLGDAVRLQISADTALDSTAKLTLEDPFGGVVDTATIAAGAKMAAALTAVPKLEGPQLYQLRIETVVGGKSEIRREPVPIVVHSAEQPTVLLWLARPSFETAALARWLRQSGAPTQVITQLAPAVVRRETFNGLDNSARQPLDAAGPFDLVILDSRLWPQLTTAQRSELPDIAARKSLLWLVGDDGPRSFVDYAAAQQMRLKATDTQTAKSPFANDELPMLRLRGYQPQKIQAGDLQLHGDNSVLYWGRSKPEGTLGFAMFGDSHRWPTAGYATDYARLWKAVFDHQLARRGSRTPITLSTALPLAGQRLTLCGSALTDSTPPLLRAVSAEENSETPLTGIAAAETDSGSCYSYWPAQAGWYRSDDERNPFSLYVFPTEAWTEWDRGLKRTQTQQMASARLGPATQAKAPQRPLPIHWPALALLLLLSFTWWRERSALR
ncbi:hypothetical protein SAMN04487965_2050 [Microbulbifer donghaiensis]|uniref:N-terminal double-transmembrane domain-containing protein n=1 Tax=Microbulbifer donghaiensis TaxID=494016 RepID=A0A1M5B2M6_9GAMM|nr:hypothetical protein [Microbulbifer donghaiensis]SHF36764.1 hypothetical protein SAMN04487965_2050 [Microbulbifer donghaiensis]